MLSKLDRRKRNEEEKNSWRNKSEEGVVETKKHKTVSKRKIMSEMGKKAELRKKIKEELL